jgi:hypothetical protein
VGRNLSAKGGIRIMQYGQVLARSLSIAWRHKYLWLLAIFAGEGAAGVGAPSSGASGQRWNAPAQATTPDWNQVSAWVSAHFALLWTIGIALVALLVVLFLVSAVANAALVKGAAEHDAERPFTLSLAWKAGLASFWPVLRLKLFALLVGVTTLVIILGLVAIAFFSATGGAAALSAGVGVGVLAALLVLAAIPFWLVFGVALLFAVRAVVLDGLSASAALAMGFRLIRRRLGRVALLWLLIVAAGVVAGIAVGVGIALLTVLAGVLIVGAAFAGGYIAAVIIGVPSAFLWLAVVFTAAGAVSAFNSTYWTIAYRRLEVEPELTGSTQMAPPSPA